MLIEFSDIKKKAEIKNLSNRQKYFLFLKEREYGRKKEEDEKSRKEFVDAVNKIEPNDFGISQKINDENFNQLPKIWIISSFLMLILPIFAFFFFFKLAGFTSLTIALVLSVPSVLILLLFVGTWTVSVLTKRNKILKQKLIIKHQEEATKKDKILNLNNYLKY